MNPALFQFRLPYFQNTPGTCTRHLEANRPEVKAPVTVEGLNIPIDQPLLESERRVRNSSCLFSLV